ncbi:MAG: prepilin-type N-terminal cleavage/methylation domain-containing protein [Candidatus Rokubacteria bacterium]|nr:prepilin-type N-terminal cleavage/methylation domain-containing protein [Candidatus Rokubacteria bacterium]
MRGFTLLELLIALAIVGALLAILLGGLHVGLTAWHQGEDRAEAHAHLRNLSELLARSIAAAFPYRQSDREGGEAQLQFQGEEERLSFVTFAPPFPLAPSMAFTAVTFAQRAGGRPGLAISEKALPNFDPLEEAEPILVDSAVTAVSFRYLAPDGDWEDRWDGQAEQGLPQAVQVRLTVRLGGRTESLPSLTISIPARTP